MTYVNKPFLAALSDDENLFVAGYQLLFGTVVRNGSFWFGIAENFTASPQRWVVTEICSGIKVAEGTTQEEAVKVARSHELGYAVREIFSEKHDYVSSVVQRTKAEYVKRKTECPALNEIYEIAYPKD